MEHNKHLNEILYLIGTSYTSEAVENGDLGKIKTLLADLQSNKKFDSFESMATKLPLGEAYAYAGKFTLEYSKENPNYEKLNKNFSIHKSLLKQSINNQEDIVLWLIDLNGSFEIVHLVGNDAYLIDCINSNKILLDPSNFKSYKEKFDTGMGKDLDTALNKLDVKKNKNTRKIIIPYLTNFDNEDYKNNTFINLIPASIEKDNDKNDDQFTFIMYFGSQIIPEKIVATTYYDTFQLCPPNC